MSLKSGEYLTKVARTVVVWPAPDANGDGAEVWEPVLDREGREVGRQRAKDKHDRLIFSYVCPEGFVNRPGYDHTDNFVMVTDRGEVKRTPTGEAIGIKPGEALVFEPDGSITVLRDEYEQYLFGLAHDDVATSPLVSDVPVEATTSVVDERDAYIAELERKLAEKSPA